MSLRARQAEFWKKVARVISFCEQRNTPIVILEWKRDLETQKKYVATGRSKTLNSKHLDGLAVDFAFLEDIQDDGTINWTPEQYAPVVEFAEFIGLKSGARFGDNPDTPVADGWDLGHLQEK